MTPKHPRLLFASYHCLLDPSSGAAVGIRALLETLVAREVPVQAFCGARMDRMGVQVAKWIENQRLPNRQRAFRDESVLFSMIDCRPSRVPITIYAPEHEMSDPSRDPTAPEVASYVSLYCQLLDEIAPDVVVTYGGGWVGDSLIREASLRGIKVVFWLRNCAYEDAKLFTLVDAIVVPSEFAADHYRRSIGIECTVIAPQINPSRVVCQSDPTQRFVTIVNPVAAKGGAVFVRIAAEIGRRRPDIPMLVVEGRGSVDDLAGFGVDLSAVNLRSMKNTDDPRSFYRLSRLVLTPALCRETFGRVTVEAMLNGIPVLSSDRGALPEVVGDGGYLFSVPAKYTEHSREVPTAAEVLPWVEKIIQLWDDPLLYDRASCRARKRAANFDSSAIELQYLDFFHNIVDSKT